MKKLIVTLTLAVMCSSLAGCIVVPQRHAYYPEPVYFTGGCYHCR